METDTHLLCKKIVVQQLRNIIKNNIEPIEEYNKYTKKTEKWNILPTMKIKDFKGNILTLEINNPNTPTFGIIEEYPIALLYSSWFRDLKTKKPIYKTKSYGIKVGWGDYLLDFDCSFCTHINKDKEYTYSEIHCPDCPEIKKQETILLESDNLKEKYSHIKKMGMIPYLFFDIAIMDEDEEGSPTTIIEIIHSNPITEKKEEKIKEIQEYYNNPNLIIQMTTKEIKQALSNNIDLFTIINSNERGEVKH
jgi:hypothetical protein